MPQSTSRLTISPAQPNDTVLVLNFIRKLAEYERLADQVEATEGDVARALFSEKPSAEAVIARWDGEPAGFALFFTSFSTFAGKPGLYLEDLFVHVEHRGKGIGKALFRYLASLVQERGYRRLEWSVLNWNQPAIEFYRSLGATPMGEWTVNRLSGQALADLANGDRSL